MGLRGMPGGSYRVLSDGDIQKIHDCSMKLFEEVGIAVHNKRALELFHQHGAEVDWKRRVFFASRDWVMSKVGMAPSSITLCGREEAQDLVIEDTKTYLGTGGTALNVLDMETHKRRPSTLQDIRDAARLVDHLENIHFFVLPLYPHDVPEEKVDVNRFWAGLSHTSKHVMGGVYTKEGVQDTIRMAEVIAGGREALRKRPFISMITCVVSPLKIDDTYGELLMTVAEQGIPLAIPTEPLAGSTSPVTLAGNVAQLNTEALAGLILAQLVNPGTPVLYGSVATINDMRQMAYLSGAVEMGLINAAAAQMAQFYRVPFYATAGMSDSKLPDIQSGYERAMTAVMVALAGANYIHDAAGLLEFAMTVSFEQYVIDNDIIGMVMRAVKGIDVNDETLAFDVMKKVGPGGNFMSEKHTVRYMRKEFFYPCLADRNNRDAWEAMGARDACRRARKEARRILATHKPLPVADEAVKEIRSSIDGIAV